MNNELEHYGIKGMKWGIRRTPAELGHKISSGISNLKKKSEKKRARRERVKKARSRQKVLKRRAEILKDPKQLYKYKDYFNKSEIEDAMKRFRMEKELRDLSQNSMRAGKEYVNTILDYVDTGVRAYNVGARIYNTFADEDSSRMPIIETGKKKK